MSEVLCELDGGVGRIRLNRPQAIHALTTQMCADINLDLEAWHALPELALVTIDHAEGRGFCAGGDVVMLRNSGAEDGAAARAFFGEEYRLNHRLFTYPKPTIAFMDGITMGGGVGISQPCRFRVATEQTRFAMPETAIGLFPDVGGGRYLSRLPGETGVFLALTGARLDGAECRFLGLATHYVPSERLPALKKRLGEAPDRAEAILDEAAETPPEPRIAANQTAIDRHFRFDALEEILASLDADPSDWAAKEAATLRTKSPLSCKVSLRLVREGAGRSDFALEMRQEYRIAVRMVATHDFQEGVRAVLVDKDNAPRWAPAAPEGVTGAMVDAIFAPLEDEEEWTPS